MSAPSPPPKPGSTEHWQAWLQRYGGDYTDDAERRAAYRDFTTNLDTLVSVVWRRGSSRSRLNRCRPAGCSG